MADIRIAVVSAFMRPPEEVDVVIFNGGDRYYIKEDTSVFMLEEARRYASEYNVYLIPEMHMQGSVLVTSLISPAGDILGSSQNAFINLRYRGEISRGGGACVLDTPLGKIALITDTDISYPQTARDIRLKGAELAIAISHMERMDFYHEMVDYKAVAMAIDAGCPVVWSNNCVTAVVNEEGMIIDNFGWLLPFTSRVTPCHKEMPVEIERRCEQITNEMLGGVKLVD